MRVKKVWTRMHDTIYAMVGMLKNVFESEGDRLASSGYAARCHRTTCEHPKLFVWRDLHVCLSTMAVLNRFDHCDPNEDQCRIE
jgi:hypothetical protein